MQIKQLPKTRLLFVCLLLFSFFTLHQSCTKLDTAHPGNHALTDAEITEKFFDLPANAPLAVRRAAAEMKKRNNISEFVKAFVKNNGYPAWDKSLIPSQPVTSVSFSGNIQETDTIVVIPVIPQNAAYVSSFVRATLNGAADLDFFRGNDYAAYSFNDVPADSVNADKAAMQIMLLNNRVFGYTKFRVVDKRVFHPSSDYSDTAHIVRILTLSGNTAFSGGVNTSNLFQTCMLVTTTTTTNHCPYPPGQCTGINGSCDNCAAVCASVVSESHLVCGVWDDGGGGSGPTGSPDPGGGTTGGGGTGTTFPCASSQTRGIEVANPCGPGTNPPPVVPVPTGFDETPCQTAKRFARNADTLYQRSNIDSVLTHAPLITLATDTVEKGFAVIGEFRTSPYNIHDTTFIRYYCDAVHIGTGHSISYIPNIGYLKLSFGAAHTHPPAGYSAQSAFDVYNLIEHRMEPEGAHYETSWTFASNGSQYAITVTNYAAAAAFINTKSQYLDVEKWNENSTIGKAFKQAYEHFEDGDSTKSNYAYEMAMSVVLKEYNTGITLNKKDATGHFQPLVVNTTIPNPNKPRKKVYVQDCI